uniref:Uncharacterized protein n=1 Tax=Salvator merianae TaxID=96440 RepID=A0A8D0BLF0_SALMN
MQQIKAARTKAQGMNISEHRYWVTEGSSAKLALIGAKRSDTVTYREDYYDTASNDLAMAQLWLSQRNQKWCLLLGSQTQDTVGHLTSVTYPSLSWQTHCQGTEIIPPLYLYQQCLEGSLENTRLSGQYSC